MTTAIPVWPKRHLGEMNVIQRAAVFFLDDQDRVISTRDVEFTSSDELLQQLESDLARFARIEAWVESVCLFRLESGQQQIGDS